MELLVLNIISQSGWKFKVKKLKVMVTLEIINYVY